MGQVENWIKAQAVAIRNLQRQLNVVGPLAQAASAIAAWLTDQPPSITDEIDRIPGRRIFTTLTADADFGTTNQGKQGEPLTYQVSQDGPFIMTHYPVAYWQPIEPENASNFLMWRPITHWPLPAQEVTGDVISLGYRFYDGGSERFFDNAAVGPIFSRPDNMVPLPVPTHFSTSALISIYPQYGRIQFGGDTPTTKGRLKIDLPGYRCVNL